MYKKHDIEHLGLTLNMFTVNAKSQKIMHSFKVRNKTKKTCSKYKTPCMFLPKCQILIWKTAMVTCTKKIKCQLQTRKPREVVILQPSDAQTYRLQVNHQWPLCA